MNRWLTLAGANDCRAVSTGAAWADHIATGAATAWRVARRRQGWLCGTSAERRVVD
jgi:hypothetical protein